MSNDRNAQTIERGLAQARQKIMAGLASRLTTIGRNIVEKELRAKKYTGFTGNAQTSYLTQVWVNGALVSEYCTGDYQSPPLRPKIQDGKTVYLSAPYEGAPRKVKGKVGIDHDFGFETLNAIDNYVPDVKKGLAVRFAVGVEYNDYIGDPIGEMHEGVLYDINERTLKIDVRN